MRPATWSTRSPTLRSNTANLMAKTLLSELQPGFSFSTPPRLRRGLAAISSPPASVLLRRGKTTPIYRLIRESCREDGAGDPCCGDCCRCPVFPSRSPVSGGERQTCPDDRGRRGNWSGDRQIREGSADDGERTAGPPPDPAAAHPRRPRNPHAREPPPR